MYVCWYMYNMHMYVCKQTRYLPIKIKAIYSKKIQTWNDLR